MTPKYYKLLIIGIFVIVIGLFFGLGGNEYLSLASFQDLRGRLVYLFESNRLGFVGLFFLAYLLATALALPAAAVLTITGGAIMGWPLATVVIVIAATLGSTVPYLAARYVFMDWAEQKFDKVFRKVNKGVEDSGWWYLLSARLSAIFPFYALNIASGVTRIRLKDYVSATFLGIIPGTMVFSFAGSQIGETAEAGDILRPGVFVALLLLATVPLIIRLTQKRLLARGRSKSRTGFRPEWYITAGQIILGICLLGCLVLIPGYFFSYNQGGISNYGTDPRTTWLFVLGFGAATAGVLLAAFRLPQATTRRLQLQVGLVLLAVLYLAVLLSTFSYKMNESYRLLHLYAAIALFLGMFIGASWLRFVAIKDAPTPTRVAFVVFCIGLIIAILMQAGVLQLLFTAQIVCGIAFGYMLTQGVRLLSGADPTVDGKI